MALSGSRSSLGCAVNVKTVLVSPEVGVHVKSTVGGAFGGGGGGGGGGGVVTWARGGWGAVRPPGSIACTMAGLFSVEEEEWRAGLFVEHAVSVVPHPGPAQRTCFEAG